jgi:membrane-bound lytic murein transglycosylase A
MRIGYDSQNGRDYTGIGALMKARGLLGPGQTSMQGIVAWLREHPEEAARSCARIRASSSSVS